MNRLFLRIYLGVLSAAVLGMLISLQVAHQTYDIELLDEHIYYVEVIHPRVSNHLKHASEENGPKVIEWWEEVSEYEIHVLPKAEPLWDAKAEFQRTIDEPVYAVKTSFRTDEFWAAVPMADSDLIIYYELHDPFTIRYMTALAIGYMITFSIMAAATYAMLRPTIRSTQELTSTVQAYAEGKLDARAPVVKGTGQLSRLSSQFNRMAAEIQHKIQEQEVMTTAISHELKTPLTQLRLALDMAIGSQDETKREEMLATMDRGLDNLDELTAELIALAKLTYGGEPLEVHRVVVGEIFARLLPNLEDVEPHVKLTLVGAANAECLGHEEHLSCAFSNLLINGKRYAHSAVKVDIQERENEVIVWVDDDGVGVPRERREEVFMPFARLDPSRNRDTGGFGLGLAIAKQSLEVQGGTIHIEDSPMGGARFVVHLPKGVEDAA